MADARLVLVCRTKFVAELGQRMVRAPGAGPPRMLRLGRVCAAISSEDGENSLVLPLASVAVATIRLLRETLAAGTNNTVRGAPLVKSAALNSSTPRNTWPSWLAASARKNSTWIG